MVACCDSGALGEWAAAPATGLPTQQGTTRPPSTRLATGQASSGGTYRCSSPFLLQASSLRGLLRYAHANQVCFQHLRGPCRVGVRFLSDDMQSKSVD
jgi:hypothetical protein